MPANDQIKVWMQFPTGWMQFPTRMDAVSNNSDWTNVLNYDIMFAL